MSQKATVIANLSMSLDGFIADRDDGVGELFGWYANGPVAVDGGNGRTFWMTETSAAVLREALASTGAFLVGRHLYDHTRGWDGHPPVDAPMVVVTHDPPADWPRDGVPITFVADGIERAVAEAKALAGDRVVARRRRRRRARMPGRGAARRDPGQPRARRPRRRDPVSRRGDERAGAARRPRGRRGRRRHPPALPRAPRGRLELTGEAMVVQTEPPHAGQPHGAPARRLGP